MTFGSFLLGMCLYINGMSQDLVVEIERVADCKRSQADPHRQWTRVVETVMKEIRYHEEIIEYEQFPSPATPNICQ